MSDSIHLASRCAARAALLLALVVPAAGSAVPLVYDPNTAVSDVGVVASMGVFTEVDAGLLQDVVDPLGVFPNNNNVIGSGTSTVSNTSTATVDVGLPGDFQNGANGITFDDLVIALPGTFNITNFSTVSLASLVVDAGLLPTPAIGFTANFGGLTITLNSSFSSPLVEGNPGEYLWAGVADVNLSGEFSPTVGIPTFDPVEPAPVPFDLDLMLALAGTFTGNGQGSTVTVGFPVDDLEQIDLGLGLIDPDPIDVDGVLTVDTILNNLTLADLNGAAVFENATPIPEPGTAALLGLGLAGLAASGRRRS